MRQTQGVSVSRSSWCLPLTNFLKCFTFLLTYMCPCSQVSLSVTCSVPPFSSCWVSPVSSGLLSLPSLYSTVQYNTVQYSTKHYNNIPPMSTLFLVSIQITQWLPVVTHLVPSSSPWIRNQTSKGQNWLLNIHLITNCQDFARIGSGLPIVLWKKSPWMKTPFSLCLSLALTLPHWGRIPITRFGTRFLSLSDSYKRTELTFL